MDRRNDRPMQRPLDLSSADQLTEGVRGAFQTSLESLRTFVEENVAWDAR